MATGKVKTLYSDKEKTEVLFPRTKVSAISDDNGNGLTAVINNAITNASEVYVGTSRPSTSGSYKIWMQPAGINTIIYVLTNGNWMEVSSISGVYVGSGDMPESYNVQIDPTGEPIDDFFAPSGYGLGKLDGKSATDCNTATANGFYTLSGASLQNPPPGNLRYGNMLVINRYSNNHITQIAYYRNDMAIRTYYSSTWSAWEKFGTRMKLLWTNASPTSAFAAQTVSLNLSDYDYVIIDTVANVETWNITQSFVFAGNKDANILIPANGLLHNRTIHTNNNGIQFDSGNAGQSANNLSCVPIRICGIKGVG